VAAHLTEHTFIDQLRDLLAVFEASEADSTYYSPQAIRDSVPLAIQDDPLPADTLMNILKTVVVSTPKTANTRFYNQLFGGKEDLAVIADMMVARMNNSMYTYKVAGPHVLIEQEVLRKACDVIGFADGEGMFCPGGSLANLVAMVLARNTLDPGVVDHGFTGDTYVAYTSEQGHYSIRKNAGIIGVGRNNVREVAVNGRGEMLAEHLDSLVQRDVEAGFVPFFVNLTAGTTALGAFDDVTALSAIAAAHNLWVHVDGSYGASVLLSKRRAALLRGVEFADSVTWNAHKMMGVPLTCSMLLSRKSGLLARNFSEIADYLFQENTDDLNPGTQSLQCGRRNDAFKVWALWKQLGNKGYEQRIEKQFQRRDQVVSVIESDPDFELIMKPALLNVCFRYRGVDSDRICSALDNKGLGKIGHGTFDGRHFMRMVIVDPDTQIDDIEQFLATIKTVASDLRCSDDQTAVPIIQQEAMNL